MKDHQAKIARPRTIEAAAADIRDFFSNSAHRVYTTRGTASAIGPDSVYHLRQLQVLFEDHYFHFITAPAVSRLRDEGFLVAQEVEFGGARATLFWRRNVRYTARLVKSHMELLAEYSSDALNKATGDYAETLTLSALRAVHANQLARNAREHGGHFWTQTGHNLDFIVEKDGIAYGVEVKNTWEYFPSEELTAKLALCANLGLRPLFVARHRHSGQFNSVREAGGLLYIFKSKVFPPGQEALTKRIWQEMRLPVIVWHDFKPQFHQAVGDFMEQCRTDPPDILS